MSRLKEIHDYLLSVGKKEEELNESDRHSVYLSMEITEYAHRNQKRENGEDYANHPFRCLQYYRDLVGIVPNEYFCVDADMMYENKVPFDGVQEVCLLHDVIEDSDFTLNDVEDIFDECGLRDYFRLYIRTPLNYITHDKTMPYLLYILICIKNPISAICKMMDLQDNIYVLSLVKFDNKNYKRAQEYLKYMFIINEQHHFIENIFKYRKEFTSKN